MGFGPQAPSEPREAMKAIEAIEAIEERANAKALSSANLVKSTGEGKRLVEQGGVEVDQVRITDANFQLEKGKRYLLRVGSKNRRFAYVVVAP